MGTWSRRGFTLVEMLVVVGIIVLLISILVPMAMHSYRVAVRTRMHADLQTIGNALEAYKTDFGDYPRLGYQPKAPSGAVLLCWALVAPGPANQDGFNGPGFQIRAGGRKYVSYLSTGTFRIGDTNNPTLVASDYTNTINDKYDHPILYFAATPNADPKVGYVRDYVVPAPTAHTTSNPPPMFNHMDNANVVTQTGGNPSPALSLMDMQVILGDLNHNGVIDPTETGAAVGVPYLLWAAGPDEKYGVVPVSAGKTGKSDDVTNVTTDEWSGKYP